MKTAPKGQMFATGEKVVHRNSMAGLWIVALDLAIVFAGSTLPTPLYLIYRRTFGFSQITLTLIYAAYVLGNLSALFFFGRLSDQIGRKKATWPALTAAVLSTLTFLFAAGTGWLLVARVLSGFATGLAGGAGTAWVAELHPQGDKSESAVIAIAANLIGLAFGALTAGLLAAYAPSPLRLTFIVYLTVVVLLAGAISLARETVKVDESRKISLRPRLGVPREIRSSFLSPALTAFGVLSLVGFYSALVPGLLSQDLHHPSPATSGLVVFGLFIMGAATAIPMRNVKSHTAMLAGLSLLLPGLALLILSQAEHSMLFLLFGTIIGGASTGLAFSGSLEVVNQIAPNEKRSEVVSSYLIACYLGNSVPVVGIGFLSRVVASLTAHIIFGVVVAAFAVIGLIAGVKYPPETEK